jgi:hypothetical protein
MALKDYQDPTFTSRHLVAIGVAAFLLLTVYLLIMSSDRREEVPNAPGYAPITTTSMSEVERTPRDEIVSRLEEIMKVREEAYRFRDTEMLRTIYSEDCPCLASDERAINELVDRNRIWTGIATSIDARSIERISEHLWIVTAVFRSSSLQIKTEDGELIHTEQGGSDLFQFTLVKPRGAHHWLLGLATIVGSSR